MELEKEDNTMSDDRYEEIERGEFDLDNDSAADLLRTAGAMLEQAPVEADPVIEIDFLDRWGSKATMELRLQGARGDVPAVN